MKRRTSVPLKLARIGALAAAMSVALTPASASSRPALAVSSTALVAEGPAPVLAPWSGPSVERDMPSAVRKRNTRAQKALYEEARAAASLPATTADGCVRSDPGGSLGPPAPRVLPRLLGHHVEVFFRFSDFPSSPACRPWGLSVVVYGGQKSSSTFKSWVERFRLDGARGRVAVMLPLNGRPPYRVLVEAQAITGRRSSQVEERVVCVGTGHAVNGCVQGIRPSAHAALRPSPLFPLRGLTRKTLDASFKLVLADESRPPVVKAIPRGARCLSLQVCEVTYADPAFPRSPYRVRYDIRGQQLASCWLGLRGRAFGEMPYEDAGRGRFLLTGCASWLR